MEGGFLRILCSCQRELFIRLGFFFFLVISGGFYFRLRYSQGLAVPADSIAPQTDGQPQAATPWDPQRGHPSILGDPRGTEGCSSSGSGPQSRGCPSFAGAPDAEAPCVALGRGGCGHTPQPLRDTPGRAKAACFRDISTKYVL